MKRLVIRSILILLVSVSVILSKSKEDAINFITEYLTTDKINNGK